MGGWPAHSERSGLYAGPREAWLNRLTITHVVLGFLGFRQALLWSENPEPRLRFLSRKEQAALERWQADYDAGRLSPELYVCAIEALIGDRAPNKAFAGFGMLGSVVSRVPRNGLTRRLGLSSSQQREALAIHAKLHQEIRGLQSQTHAVILDHLRGDKEALNAFLSGEARLASLGRYHCLFTSLASALQLESERQATLIGEFALLRSQVQREHEKARSRFISLLTPSQWESLQVIEQVPVRAPESWRKQGCE